MNELLVRPAREEDIPRLVEMGADFYHHAKAYKNHLAFDPISMERLFLNVIHDDMQIILVGVRDEKIVGSISAFITPWICDFSQPIAIESWWWIDRESSEINDGNKLLQEFEGYAKHLGVRYVIMQTFKSEKEIVLRRLYKNLGYDHLSTQMIKEL